VAAGVESSPEKVGLSDAAADSVGCDTVSSPPSGPTAVAKPPPAAIENKHEPVSTTVPPISSAPANKLTPTTDPEVEERKRQTRAARFGLTVTSPQVTQTSESACGSAATKGLPDDEDKMKKRAERFGIPFVANVTSEVISKAGSTKTAQNVSVSSISVQDSMNALDEEKKRKRAERFAMTGAGSADKKAKVDV